MVGREGDVDVEAGDEEAGGEAGVEVAADR